MKLRTIRVESFKRFRAPMALEGLQPGINLIAAPNGKGKSTLAEAVRVGFLERHRTAELGKTLAPWTLPGASPSLQIEFERDGKVHLLQKVFGGKKSCTLTIEGQSALTGEAAEERLSEMFAFSYSKRGASSPDTHGVPGLLWVRQGSSGQIFDQAGAAHEYISRALGNGVSELAATTGDQVIDAVEKELAELHTKGGKPTGDYARLTGELGEARVREGELKTKVQEFQEAVDRFATLQAHHAKGERDRPWDALRHKISELRQQQAALGELASKIRELSLQATVTKEQITQLENSLLAFDEDDHAVETRKVDLRRAAAKDENTFASVRVAEQELTSARAADGAARQAAATAREAARRGSAESAWASADRRRRELATASGTATARQQELQAQKAEEARLKPFDGASAQLQKAQSKLQAAQAHLDAVSTRLEFDLQGGAVSIAGEAVQGAGRINFTRPTEIAIVGAGTIRVLPGAKDLAQLESEVHQAQEAVANLLRGFGVRSTEDVAQSERTLQTVRQAIQGLVGVIAGVAPAGVEHLLSELAGAEGESLRCREVLDGLPATPVGGGEVIPESTADQLEAAAQRAFALAQEKHDAARVAAAAAQEQLRIARDELSAAEARVADPNRATARKDAQTALHDAKASEQSLQQQIGQLKLQLEQANPQLLSADIERFAKSADAQQLAHEQLAAALNQLGGQLRAQGALGLEEEAASVSEEVLRLERRVEDRRRRAEALTHLRDLLVTERAEVARSIRAPLQKHINHYLAIQFPGLTIELDAKLRPHQVTRQGTHGTEIGTFEEMSGGEREQLGIIARFAYADLLKEKGKPTLLMLDDSFVNCDVDRLAVMKRVIYDAATRHQILIFTCHEENWRDMGVAPIALQ